VAATWRQPRPWSSRGRAELVFALIEHRQFGEARRRIAEARKIAGESITSWHADALHAAAACLALQDRDHEAAGAALRAMFACARQRGEESGFLNIASPWMPRLCAQALREGVQVEYVRDLIRTHGWPPPSPHVPGWPWPTRVHTLGEFRILRDDAPVPFGRKTPRKPMSLLKALIAFGGHEVPEHRLIDALWPEEDGDRAQRAFALALHRLRRLVGGIRAIEVRDRRVTLNPYMVWTDARAFQDALERPPATAPDTVELEGALELYRGGFLADLEDAPWAVSPRQRLRRGFVGGVSRLGRRLEAAGRWDEAIAWYMRALDAEETAEELYEGLVRCYRR
jgi:DNA-binding SARP family transcriptional activator